MTQGGDDAALGVRELTSWIAQLNAANAGREGCRVEDDRGY